MAGSKHARTHELLAANGEPCHWCKRSMNIDSPRLMPTRDHVHPRSKGGRYIEWACYDCNQVKADMTLVQWIAFMVAHPKWWNGVPGPVRSGYRAGKPLPYDDNVYILTHGKKAWRETQTAKAARLMNEVKERREMERDPLVRAVLDQFPGAEIVDVRHPEVS